MSTAANTVVVACKIPAGIIMQGYKMTAHNEPVMGGGSRETQIAVPHGPAVRIKGPAAPQGSVAPGYVEGGYVLTPNVPKDTAEAWFSANKDSDMVKNRLIYFAEKADAAADRARGNGLVLSGLERLDVTVKSENGRTMPADYRWPRANNANLTAIGTDNK